MEQSNKSGWKVKVNSINFRDVGFTKSLYQFSSKNEDELPVNVEVEFSNPDAYLKGNIRLTKKEYNDNATRLKEYIIEKYL